MGTLIFVWTVIKAILGISFVIFWHELGHFLVAKWNGVYVKTFSVGFPPRLVRLFKYKETDYVLGSIPLGGYVHMLGEDEGQTEPPPGTPSETDAEGQPRSNIEPSMANHPGAFFNKSVWARMAIISAGVIMNVLLGLICFQVVYMAGGKLQAPAVIGGVGAGGPAYKAGMLPGDVVHAIDDQESVTFEDLNRIVVHAGPEQRIRFLVTRDGEDDPIELMIRPERDPIEQLPKIRVALPLSLELYESDPFLAPPGMEGAPGGRFEGGDRVTRVGPAGGDLVEVRSPYHLKSLLDRYRDRPVVVEIARGSDRRRIGGRGEPSADDDRPATATETVTLPPVRFVDFGVRLTPGPVVAIRDGSPAERAGVEAGDLIVAVDGDRDYDPMRLPSIAAELVGESIALTVQRGDEEIELAVEPAEGASWSQAISPDSPLNVDTIGLAMRVEPKVAEVRTGSPASRAGIEAGDEFTGLRFTWEPPDESAEARTESLTFGERYSYLYAFDFIQRFPAEKVELTIAGREEPLAIVPEPVYGWYLPERGLLLQDGRAPIAPMGFAEAFKRAGGETLGVITSFYTLLQRLYEGQVGTKGLSGPIRIGKMMYDFAGVDFVTFLYFIGFISINLAVVNFLPIPPLDGGRMVFLIGEAVRGRPLPDSWQALPTYLGIFFLLALMIFVLIQDTLLTFFN